MPALTLRIDPDGSTAVVDKPLMTAATDEHRHTSVVVCAGPVVDGRPLHVMFIDDFGAEDQPINRKAWALYGRSPIYGVALLGLDGDAGELADDLVELLAKPLDEWPMIPPQALAALTGDEPPRPEMVARRADADAMLDGRS